MTPPTSEIVSQYAGYVWRVLAHLGVPESQLKDASQEVFLVALRRLDQFEGRSSLRTWLFGICRKLAADHRRRAAYRREVVTDQLPESIVLPAQEGALWAKRAYTQLLCALDDLADEPRQVFILFEIEQLSMEEIATTTGAPLRTCYSRLEVARARIRAQLRRQEQVTRPVRREVSR